MKNHSEKWVRVGGYHPCFVCLLLLLFWFVCLSRFRSSHRGFSVKKGVLRNFAKLTGKHLCQSLFFNKVEGLRPATLLKKRLWHRCEFCAISRNTFSTEHLQTTASVICFFLVVTCYNLYFKV